MKEIHEGNQMLTSQVQLSCSGEYPTHFTTNEAIDGDMTMLVVSKDEENTVHIECETVFINILCKQMESY